MKLKNIIENAKIYPLNDFRAGTKVQIAKINAGHCLKERLASMGLFANTDILVVRNDGAGQIIVGVKNSKVILGRGMGHKIFVRPR